MNDLKFTTAGTYMEDSKKKPEACYMIESDCTSETSDIPYYINESGLKINSLTGTLIND